MSRDGVILKSSTRYTEVWGHFEVQTSKWPKTKWKNIWAILKFECISSHMTLSLSQQFWAILRYTSYSPGDISSRSAGDLIWKNTPISINIMTPHTATHKQQPEHFGPRIFILKKIIFGRMLHPGCIIRILYFHREHVREIAYGIASVRNPANRIT